MADIAVNFAVHLLGLALNEVKHQRGVRDDVEWLHRELQRMRCFLLDAERRSLSGDEAVKNWVREITDAAYEAEDIAAKFARRQQRRGVKATLQRYGLPSKELRDIGNDIKSLRGKIEEIRDSRATYGISSINSNVESSCSDNIIYELRRKPLFQNEEDVFGLENDKKRVTELLQAEESRRYVIGIVGMGGMGKTTLSRQVLKSISRRQFPKLAWVDLSQNYIQNHRTPIDSLLIEIAKQVIQNSLGLESMRTEDLSELLKSNLKDERYLIVMDDMWETDVWDLVKDHLPDMKNGSRIIITTRNEIVAEHPALHFPFHRMEGLDDKHSWDLFTHLVFEDEEEITRECIGELKDLAEELVQGCGGSPLALTVLGGLLAGKKKTHSAWQDALGKRKWLRGEAGKNCLDILKLSYKDLPHHLKWCFLYLSAFPEDHKIDVEKLIRLWVAEGFVAESETGSNDEEDVAGTYLDALKQRCLIRIFESRPSTFPRRHMKINKDFYEYCRIHDLVRELSINEAKEANFMNFEIKYGSNRGIHRLSLQDDTWLDLDDTSPSLRTLLKFTDVSVINFKHFNLLRVLDLEGAGIYQLPEEVGDMILLRYLSIKRTKCWFLPNSISKLSYLETLDCEEVDNPIRAPDNVWKIKTLKNILGVIVDREFDISHLVKLHTLVGRKATPDFVQSLFYLTHLRVLSVASSHWDWRNPIPLPMGIWKAMGSWPFLNFLCLRGFNTKDVVCDKEGFPHLQILTMSAVDFDSWEVEKGSMPSLECIFMIDCKGLKRLPNGLAHCKKLRILQCLRMGYEFMQWYYNGIQEFRYINDIMID